VRRAMRTAVTLIEPALILTFGALVGFIALAMLQAIYGIDLKG
jgi:general secretion pathway protein F